MNLKGGAINPITDREGHLERDCILFRDSVFGITSLF